MWKAHAAGAIGDTEAQGLAEAKFTADQLEGRHGPPVRLQTAIKREHGTPALSSDAKCNTPRRFDIGKVVQDP